MTMLERIKRWLRKRKLKRQIQNLFDEVNALHYRAREIRYDYYIEKLGKLKKELEKVEAADK